jgi:hypothetical protein
MKKYTQIDKFGFEIETCSRCGGSGHWSYCQQYGTMCFKCLGKGFVHTLRGDAARKHFVALMSVPVESLIVGQKFLRDEGPFNAAGWCTVIEIGLSDGRNNVTGFVFTVNKTGERGSSYYYLGDLIRVAQTEDERINKLAEALAYQDTLTKRGK